MTLLFQCILPPLTCRNPSFPILSLPSLLLPTRKKNITQRGGKYTRMRRDTNFTSFFSSFRKVETERERGREKGKSISVENFYCFFLKWSEFKRASKSEIGERKKSKKREREGERKGKNCDVKKKLSHFSLMLVFKKQKRKKKPSSSG